jgi:hypothetical protein
MAVQILVLLQCIWNCNYMQIVKKETCRGNMLKCENMVTLPLNVF